MKIVDVRLTGLAGATVEGGWAEELVPEDNLHTIVEVVTDEGLVGIGSAVSNTTSAPFSSIGRPGKPLGMGHDLILQIPG